MPEGHAQHDRTQSWTFLTNHAHVLLVVTREPKALLREVAEQVGITPRATQLILGDLERAGYLHRARHGRRNHYTVLGGPMRHPLERGRAVDDLLTVLGAVGAQPAAGARVPKDEPPTDAPDASGGAPSA